MLSCLVGTEHNLISACMRALADMGTCRVRFLAAAAWLRSLFMRWYSGSTELCMTGSSQALLRSPALSYVRQLSAHWRGSLAPSETLSKTSMGLMCLGRIGV